MSFSEEVVGILEQNGILYKLWAGGMLGGIKFRKFLPW